MNARNQFIVKGVIGLVVLWLVVFAAIKVSGSFKPTPEKIQSYAENNSLSEIDEPEKRREVIGKVADMLNQLEPEQFRRFTKKAEDGRDRQDRFFEQMSPEEQMFFMEKRIGKAFKQMMQAFNEMDRDKRKNVIQRSLKRMQDNPDGRPGEKDVSPEMVEKITGAGLKAFYSDASAETKLDLAPLMEEMQRTMGKFRDRQR